ncbi:MAG: hypothetical protein C4348_02070 [Patescibacteria group bacterium]
MINFLGEKFLGFIYFLNSFLNDLGLSVILFTFLLKLSLLPLDYFIFLEEIKIRRLKPEIDKITKEYKNDVIKQAEKLTELYKKEKFNPFLNLVLQLVPLPILISIFFVLQKIIKENKNIYFLGLIDLSQKNLFLFLLTLLFQFLSIFLIKTPNNQKKFQILFLVLISIIIFNFPSLFMLYWLINTILFLLERKLFEVYNVKISIISIPKDNTDRS